MVEPLLNVQSPGMVSENRYQALTAVDYLSFLVEKGQTLDIVDKNGSGGAMASFSAMELLPDQGRVSDRRTPFEGKDLVPLKEKEVQKLRGGGFAMIFQSPMISSDQVYTVNSQIVEAILTHEPVGKEQAKGCVLELLTAMGIA